MAQHRFPRWLIAIGVFVAAIVLVVVFWNWDWFIPFVQARASATLGRPVTIAHLHVHPGGITRIVADDVEIANPDGFPPDSRMGRIDHLAVDVDIGSLLHDRSVIVVPRVAVEHPVFDIGTSPSGEPNWKLAMSSSSGSGPSVKIGDLVIDDGHAKVVDPKLKANFALDVATREAKDATDGERAQLLVDAKGTYAGQPITGRFVGGAVLSLRDKSHPYPIDLHVENGPTHVAVTGTVQDPLAFKGADIKLDLAGPDMAQLYHLTGIPIPETPPYRITGDLDYADRKIRFDHMVGRVGHSDLEGSIAVDPGTERPHMTANLSSKLVNLTDLGGFIGATPGPAGKGATPEQQREKTAAKRSPNLLPDQPIKVPKLKAADVDLRYRGHRIEGRSIPLDDLAVDLTVRDGDIRVHPLSFGVGRGRISGNIDLTPRGDELALKADVEFQQVDVSRIMAATHTFGGAGTIGGRAVLDGSGNSLARIMGDGNGDLKLFMTGGDLSGLLVALSGLEFGNALLSALGLPERTQVRCMIVDLPLQRGVLDTKVLLLDTTEANIIGSGTINLRNETIDYQLKTEPKHFTIGSLPAPIDIRGQLKSPSILPDPAALAARGGIAAALGVLLTPLAALLPTIQLGLGKDTDCSRTVAEIGEQGKNRMSPAEIRRHTGHGAASGGRSRK
ncbi:MAG: AsmA family protein [Alphaproteobacteria bacterium]|nr:AsmA family protein [Alphaproteobacteria bacterium]